MINRGMAASLAMAIAMILPAAEADPLRADNACLAGLSEDMIKPDVARDTQRIQDCTDLLRTETDPDNQAQLLVARSQAYYVTKAYIRALADLQRLDDIKPGYPVVEFDRALIHISMGYFTLALPEIETSIRMGTPSAEAYTLRAVAKTFQGLYGDAITDADLAISGNSSLPGAYSIRGFAELEVGEIDHAILDFDQAIRLNPADYNAYFYRGRAHFALDQYEMAISDFEQAHRIEPGEPAAGEYISQIQALLTSTGNTSGNAADATQPTMPSMPVARTHNCGAYYPYISSHLPEAGDVIIHFDVSQTGAISNVGIERSSGFERLDRAAVICVSRHWRNTAAMNNGEAVATPRHLADIRFLPYPGAENDPARAKMLIALGRYDEAVAAFGNVLSGDPNNVDIYFERGFANYVLHNYADAVRDFDKALHLKSDFDEAAAGREQAQSAILSRSPGGHGI